jgi:hypothetical protein
MNVYRIPYLPRITTSHGNRHGQSGLMKMSQYDLIPGGKPVLCQREAAKSIIFVRVCSGKVNREICIACTKRRFNSFFKGDQVGGINCPIF